jgi:acyl-coenzyme A synthetase/AMP-(fatty) acid ligase
MNTFSLIYLFVFFSVCLKVSWARWLFVPVILITWETEIGKIMVQHQTRQRVSKTPSQQKKPGMVVHGYNPATWSHR